MSRPALTPHAGYAGARASVYVEFLTNPSIREYSFFAQDEWRIDRDLTINAGLRYDLQQFAKPDVRNPDAQLAAAIDTRHLPRPKPSRMKQVFAPGLGRCLRPAERGKRNRAAAKRSHRGAVLGGLRRSFAAFLPTDTNNWGPRLGVTSAPAGSRYLARVGYGLFYGRTPSIMVGTADSNNGINVQTIMFTGNLVPAYFADHR